MYLYLSLALTICAGIGFGYGLYRFFRDESALYVRMIVFAIGCAMLGRLFETLLILVNGSLTNGFHVGMLGIIGSFLFLFSANFGQMDSIVDDGSKRFFKTRLISFSAPLVIMARSAAHCAGVVFSSQASDHRRRELRSDQGDTQL